MELLQYAHPESGNGTVCSKDLHRHGEVSHLEMRSSWLSVAPSQMASVLRRQRQKADTRKLLGEEDGRIRPQAKALEGFGVTTQNRGERPGTVCLSSLPKESTLPTS